MVVSLKTLPRRYRILPVLAVAMGAVWAGCGDDKKNPVTPPNGGGPTTTSFNGVFANGTENGSMYVTVNSTNLSRGLAAPRTSPGAALLRAFRTAANSITATGTLKPVGGGTISLSGTYDDQNDSLNLSNIGAGYTFSGVYDTTGTYKAVLGQYAGPNGGGFFGCVTGVVGAGAYCGTFVSEVTTTTGNWDVLVTGGEVAGIAFPTVGEPFGFEGTIETTGTMRDMTAGDGDPGIYLLTVTGTLNTTTNTISGTWTFEDYVTPFTDSGTWSGSLCPQ